MATTNKSMPAPAVPVSANVKKWMSWTIVALAVIVAIAIIVSIIRKPSEEKKPLKTQNQQQTLRMPANGDSKRITPPVGKRVILDGEGFKTHCVHPDGRDGIVNDPVRPCTAGFTSLYVEDTTGKENIVTYRFE